MSDPKYLLNLGRANHMAQHFYGQLSGFSIEQKEELDRSVSCIRDCQQYLDMPDIQSQSDVVCRFERLFRSFLLFFVYFRNFLVIQIDLFGLYVLIQVNHLNNY